ncbi:Werner syndrome ATP-dependent helicase homolog [Actinia tenebrosa]|uniref:3'-5' exonuclease n=1 Tax=Actinia tenebrosa TaxID=6105 RepID=A0A6P8HVW2_ACTTE|nr:Werner syndrome ATP-dependent helicase homolog [Actinia tenebrosa]
MNVFCAVLLRNDSLKTKKSQDIKMSDVEAKKRKLPEWLKRSSQSDIVQTLSVDYASLSMDKPGRTLPSSFYEGFNDAKLPLLKYNGRIIYCLHKDECNFICDSLITSAQEETVMGFDMEWRVSFIKCGGSRKTALIQLCASEDTCYLFHLSRMSGFPSALKLLLENDKILKTGVGIISDIGKLSKEFDVNPRGLVDLSVLANQQLNSNENWSLTGLVMNLFKQQLNKDHNIRCSNWEVTPLSKEQHVCCNRCICWIDGLQKSEVNKIE